MRAIDADELKTAFPICDNSKPVFVACVLATINHMPTIEPERKRGKWKKVYEGNGLRYECDKCGERYPNAYGYNFCPNCGADMRGDQ